MSKPRIALIAHDAKKDEIVALAGQYRETLATNVATARMLLDDLARNMQDVC